jgi:hypothetical protein
VTLSDLIKDDDTFTTQPEWEAFIIKYAPKASDVGDEAREEWINDRLLDYPMLRPGIPNAVKRAIVAPPHPEYGSIVHVEPHRGSAFYARLLHNPGRHDHLSVLWLDISRFPHDTGRVRF